MVAIGDSASDIPMFRIAHFRMAVVNTDEQLRAQRAIFYK
jgi:phosphoserine phosphatase